MLTAERRIPKRQCWQCGSRTRTCSPRAWPCTRGSRSSPPFRALRTACLWELYHRARIALHIRRRTPPTCIAKLQHSLTSSHRNPHLGPESGGPALAWCDGDLRRSAGACRADRPSRAAARRRDIPSVSLETRERRTFARSSLKRCARVRRHARSRVRDLPKGFGKKGTRQRIGRGPNF